MALARLQQKHWWSLKSSHLLKFRASKHFPQLACVLGCTEIANKDQFENHITARAPATSRMKGKSVPEQRHFRLQVLPFCTAGLDSTGGEEAQFLAGGGGYQGGDMLCKATPSTLLAEGSVLPLACQWLVWRKAMMSMNGDHNI